MHASIDEDGIWALDADGMPFNYGRRWAGYGYVVPIRPLYFDELRPGVLFSRETEQGDVFYLLVRQRDTLRDARQLADDMEWDRVYDLREKKWVSV